MIEQLKEKIRLANEAYRIGEPIMSDKEYDILVGILSNQIHVFSEPSGNESSFPRIYTSLPAFLNSFTMFSGTDSIPK